MKRGRLKDTVISRGTCAKAGYSREGEGGGRKEREGATYYKDSTNINACTSMLQE